MNARCIELVGKVVGRNPSVAEIKAIDDRISRHMRQNAAKDPQGYLAKSPAERAIEASQTSREEFQAEKAKVKQQKALDIITTARKSAKFDEFRAKGRNGAQSVGDMIEQTEIRVRGVKEEYMGNLMESLRAAEPKFWGWLENPAAIRDFVKEVLGQRTGNPIAEKGAKAWLENIEMMRQRFNRAGGDVAKLAYGYLPQPHDAIRIAKAGKDAWVKYTQPLLKRNLYMKENGQQMSETELTAFLEKAYDPLATDGLNKLEPGKFMGSGKTANHGGDARQIHFKDAESYLSYMNAFGKGSVFDAMVSHVGGMARDIGMVEDMGTNPNQMFRHLNDKARIADGGNKFVYARTTPQELWDNLTGFTDQIVNVEHAQKWASRRNYLVGAKLQGTMLQAITDMPTMFVYAKYNKMPIWGTLKDTIAAFGKEGRAYAADMGMTADSVSAHVNSWAENNTGKKWTSFVADKTMRLSLLSAWTNGLKQGFSLSLMSTMGRLSRTDWGLLHKSDRLRMESKGLTEQDWQVFQKATLQDWRGSQMLTPKAIRAQGEGAHIDAAVSRLLGFIADESEFAVTTPDLMAKAGIKGSSQKGTSGGEFRRNISMFKSFPYTMATRHMRRIANARSQGNNPWSHGILLMPGLTIFGALSVQLTDMATGKDPRDMGTLKFWTAAFMKGGGLGIFGDILYTGMGGNSRGGQSNWTNLLGPVYGTIADGLDVTLGNAGKALKGQETHFGADLLRFGRSNTPLVNLWYAKAAIDHLGFHQIQDFLSPGYLSKMRARTQKDWGQDYWWAPGEVAPDRAPDLTAVAGDN